MWIALSAIAWSPIGTWKLMMIGLATPTIEPLTGLNDGGRNGGSPANGVGSCPATGPVGTASGSVGGRPNGSLGGSASGSTGAGAGGSTGALTTAGSPGEPGASPGSARAVPVPRTSTNTNVQDSPRAIPAACKAAASRPRFWTHVQRDISNPSSHVPDPVWHSALGKHALSGRRTPGLDGGSCR